MAFFFQSRLLLLLLALAHVTAVAMAAPLTTAAADGVIRQAEAVAAELERALEDDDSPQVVALRSCVDTAAGIRVYLRDGQLLFALSTTRAISAVEKSNGERAAASLARRVLQKEFASLDTAEGFGNLDSRVVRAVLIEPEAVAFMVTGSAHRAGGPTRAHGVTGGCAACRRNFFGDGRTPIPFAPAGYWAGGSTTSAPCVGCR